MDGPAERYLGAYALCVADDRMLLVRNSTGHQQGMWTLPGGGVEAAEHPDDAVRRELTEETGLTGRIDRVAGVYARHHPPDDGVSVAVDHIGIVYRMLDLAGELRAEIDGTSDRCAWLRRDEVAVLAIVPLGRFGVSLVWPE